MPKNPSRTQAPDGSVKPRPKPKPKPLKCYASFLMASECSEEKVVVDLQYDIGHTDKRVRVTLQPLDQETIDAAALIGKIPNAIVMIRSRPGEAYFAKRERYSIELSTPPSWPPHRKKHDFRQDVIDAILKHWHPAPDWQEEHPEGLPLIAHAVQIDEPLLAVDYIKLS
jgi:hypothetical protein